MKRNKEKGFRKELIMPLFIVIIMVMSVFGYMWGSSRTRMDYNGFRIYQLENGNFMLNAGGSRLVFRYFPSELEPVNASKGVSTLFSTPMAYAAYDPRSEYTESLAEAQFSISQMLEGAKGVFVQAAFTSETKHSLPVVSCSNATQFVPVIIIGYAENMTEIVLEDSCVTIKARNRQEMIMAYERFLYSVLGVME